MRPEQQLPFLMNRNCGESYLVLREHGEKVVTVSVSEGAWIDPRIAAVHGKFDVIDSQFSNPRERVVERMSVERLRAQRESHQIR
jgi:hypothetical protein